jgi:hypothetical protein
MPVILMALRSAESSYPALYDAVLMDRGTDSRLVAALTADSDAVLVVATQSPNSAERRSCRWSGRGRCGWSRRCQPTHVLGTTRGATN